MKRLACLVLITATMGLAACSGGAETDPSIDPSSEDALAKKSDVVDVGQEDNGKTIVVEQGKDIRLTLAETASTGYRWGVVSTDRSFGYPTPKDGTPIAATGPVGAKGKRQFVWKTASPFLEPGSEVHEVKLENRRDFENVGDGAAGTFYLMVQIKAKGAVPANPSLPTVFIGRADDGKSFDAKVGQKVTVRLAENGSTGYRWYVDVVDRSLGQPEKTYEASDSDTVGSGGQAAFTWTPSSLALGKHLVTLKKSRGAEGDAAEQFKFTLDVAD